VLAWKVLASCCGPMGVVLLCVVPALPLYVCLALGRSNIMFDPRVRRGNTHATTLLAAVSTEGGAGVPSGVGPDWAPCRLSDTSAPRGPPVRLTLRCGEHGRARLARTANMSFCPLRVWAGPGRLRHAGGACRDGFVCRRDTLPRVVFCVALVCNGRALARYHWAAPPAEQSRVRSPPSLT
jgi:hypothetical protein